MKAQNNMAMPLGSRSWLPSGMSLKQDKVHEDIRDIGIESSWYALATVALFSAPAKPYLQGMHWIDRAARGL